jgi:hypothetical protein
MRSHSCATTSWASDIADRSLDRGKTWPAPAGAVRVKSFEIYRYDPDSGGSPRLDAFEVDLGLRANGSRRALLVL